MSNEKKPTPPDAFETWLDYALFLALWSSKGGKDVHEHGHAELDELHKKLAEVDAERAEAIKQSTYKERKMDHMTVLLGRYVERAEEAEQERNSVLDDMAKLAQDYRKAQEEICELRSAALALGKLEEGMFEYNDEIRLPWNAHIAKLQAKDKEKQ